MKTDPELLRLLAEAAQHEMTPEELLQQKISWVYGQMMDCAPYLSREAVECAVRKYVSGR